MQEIRNYIIDLDGFSTSMTDNYIKENGLTNAIEKQFNWIKCDKYNSDGVRLRQTIDYTYKSEISKLVYMINKVEDEDLKQKYYDKLIEIHNHNIEFEKVNPPIVYTKKKPSNSPRRKGKDDTDKPSKSNKLSEFNSINPAILIHNFKIKTK